MKNLTVYILLLVAFSGTIISCSKENSDELAGSTNGGKAAAETFYRFAQEETFFNPCCGEEMTLNYTVVVVDMGIKGFQASLNQLSGVGLTSGNAYYGANTQGESDHFNNATFHFSTVLTSKGCTYVAKQLFHITVDSQ